MTIVLNLLVLLAVIAAAAAESFEIEWYTIDGGGGTSAAGQYEISGTIGQPDAGSLSRGTYILEGGFWAGIFALQLGTGPRLSITHSGTNVVLSWPASADVFRLESRNEVDTGLWSTVPQSQSTNNGLISVTTPLAPGNQYFRLQTP